mgnify:FL=1
MKQLNLEEYEQFIFNNKIPDGYKKVSWWCNGRTCRIFKPTITLKELVARRVNIGIMLLGNGFLVLSDSVYITDELPRIDSNDFIGMGICHDILEYRGDRQ